MASDLFHLSHVHYHPEKDYPVLEEFSVMERRPRVLLPLNRPDVPHLTSKLTESASEAIRLAWKTDHDHVLFGPSGDLHRRKFQTHESAWKGQEVQYEVVARMTYAGSSPDEVARRFRDDVAGGNLIFSVTGGETGSVDVRPDGLEETSATGQRHMPVRPEIGPGR